MRKTFLLFIAFLLLLNLPLFSIAEDQKLHDRKVNSLAPHREYFYTNKKTTNADTYRDPDFGGYGYNAYDPSDTYFEGPISFTGSDPTSITLLAPTTSPNYIAGACWNAAEDTWYGSHWGGGLYSIDPTNGNMTYIAATNQILLGLEYDDTSGIMYGSDGNNLYTVDWTTGATTLIGSHNIDFVMISIACDVIGNMYGVTVDFTEISDLYSINLTTGEATSISSTGEHLLYAQDLAFDKDNGILYLTAYFGDGTPPGLYEINIQTAEMTCWGNFPGGLEVSGFAIPYTYFKPEFSAYPILGYYPTLDVQFTDLSLGYNIFNWFWDFQNDGIYDSFEQNPNYTYTDIGIYDVKLKISNETQVDSLIKYDYITVELVPPATPTDIQIEISGNDVILNWAEVDTTIFGTPIDVDFYIISGSHYPYDDFMFLGATADTIFTQNYVTVIYDKMFYQIKSFVGTRLELDEYVERCLRKPEEKYHLK